MIRLILAGLADRFRGNGGIFEYSGKLFNTPRLVTLLLTGYTVSLILGVYWGMDAVKIAFGIGIGFSFGIGMPLGSLIDGITQHENILRNPTYKYEWWQFGELKDNAYLALAFRGAMIGLPLIAFKMFAYAVIISISYAIALPLSVYVVVKLKEKRIGNLWGAQEYIRSPIAGLVAGSIIGVVS